MPRKKHNKSTGRRYDIEYARYQGKPAQIKRRAKRNGARAKMAKAGKVRKGDGKDVHHVSGRMDNSSANLRAISKHKNRSFHRKGPNKGRLKRR